MYCRMLRIMVLGLLAGVLALGDAFAQKPNPGKGPVAVDASKALPSGTFVGKLVSLPDSDRMFEISATVPQIVPNPNARPNPNIVRQIAAIQRDQVNVVRSRNKVQALMQLQRAILQLEVMVAQAEANAYRVIQIPVKVDFQASEDLQVRVLQPPAAFDDKGNIKKYTAAELKELKGKNPNLPGYEASNDALKVGQMVRVTLAPYKPPSPGATEKKPDLDKDKDKDAEEPKKDKAKAKPMEPTEKKRQVNLIVILDDSASSDSTPTSRKDKK